jgi:hypothetical protein
VTAPQPPRIGLALSTIGRATLAEFLRSVAQGSVLPTEVAVADHTPGGDLRVEDDLPFPVLIVPSKGGASEGRNDAVAALGPCDVLGFPNDDNLYLPTTLQEATAAFSVPQPPTAAAGTLLEFGLPKYRLPPDGRLLDRRTVWRAIEPATFLQREAFTSVGGFREDMGTGAQSPWQSGDGTDTLLRIMARGGTVQSRPGMVVLGRGERKGLAADALVAKHRAYARGTGFVFRSHQYPMHARLRLLAGPLLKATSHDPDLRLSLRLSVARTAGRIEGLTGRMLPGAKDPSWL